MAASDQETSPRRGRRTAVLTILLFILAGSTPHARSTQPPAAAPPTAAPPAIVPPIKRVMPPTVAAVKGVKVVKGAKQARPAKAAKSAKAARPAPAAAAAPTTAPPPTGIGEAGAALCPAGTVYVHRTNACSPAAATTPVAPAANTSKAPRKARTIRRAKRAAQSKTVR